MAAGGLVDDLGGIGEVLDRLGVGVEGHDEDIFPVRPEGEEIAAANLDHGRVDAVVRARARRLDARRPVVRPRPRLHRRARRVADDRVLAAQRRHAVVEYVVVVGLDHHGGLWSPVSTSRLVHFFFSFLPFPEMLKEEARLRSCTYP